MDDIYYGFYTLQDYLATQKHLHKSEVSKQLVEYLVNRIIGKPEIRCMIQQRGDKAIIFVPVSLIESGKAEPGMQDKNIITVWYLKNRIDIEIEDRNNKVKCFAEEDINDNVLERIFTMYNNIK